MTDLSPASRPTVTGQRRRLDKAWLAIALVPLAVLLLDPASLGPILHQTAASAGSTVGLVIFAVLTIGYLRASGTEMLIARAFEGREARMIVLAALIGGLSPFCSCEVIPFIAMLLAAGAPLSAVMAFWLASPLMDPAMFLITAGALGPAFALAKTGFALAIGLGGGFGVWALKRTVLFADPLRPKATQGQAGGHADDHATGCCGSDTERAFTGRPVWRFWSDPARRATFRATSVENALFLGKWLMLAYLLEALMITYVPATLISGLVGGEGLGPILTGALLGGPAYLNGYAAAPLVAGLMEQGMSPGAAMSFVIAGGVSCIPAAVAVWALVRARVFASYLIFAFIGSVAAGLIWSAIA